MSKGKIEKKSRILDLGCGKKKREGAIGVDFSDRHAADVIHDLNVFPYYSISVAQKVNEVWNNIDEWWFSAEVQKARKIFCWKYARVSNKPIDDFKAIFENAVNIETG